MHAEKLTRALVNPLCHMKTITKIRNKEIKQKPRSKEIWYLP